MRSILCVAALCAAVCLPRLAAADEPAPTKTDAPAKRRPVEFSVGGSLGGAVIELVDPTEGSTTRTWSLNVHGRLRRSENTPFGLEFAVHIPHGVSMTALLDLVRVKDLGSAHLAVGIFRPIADQHLSVEKIDRSGDLTLGWGVEFRVYKSCEGTVDWRVFLADPTNVPRMYGDFTRPIYDEAMRGGQLWLGVQCRLL